MKVEVLKLNFLIMINISLLNYFNKYLVAVFNERLKQAKLATNNDFNTKFY